MARPPLPLTVIGGFLGAGKTTLLNRWLRDAGGQRLAVLVNDFGALNIDAQLVSARAGAVVALSNGCVCCQIGDDLGAALITVLDGPTRFDAVVVEASGVSDPARIGRYGRATPDLVLDGVIVLVDSTTLGEQAGDPLLADTLQRQVAGADLLVLNKVDLVTPAQRLAALACLDRWAPAVPRIETVDAAVPLPLLSSLALQPGGFPGGREAAPRNSLPAQASQGGAATPLRSADPSGASRDGRAAQTGAPGGDGVHAPGEHAHEVHTHGVRAHGVQARDAQVQGPHAPDVGGQEGDGQEVHAHADHAHAEHAPASLTHDSPTHASQAHDSHARDSRTGDDRVPGKPGGNAQPPPDHPPDHGAVFETWSGQPDHVFAAQALRALLDNLPAGVLRLKGFVQTDTLGWTEVQVAGRRATLRRAAAEPPPRAGVVAIGLRGQLPRAALQALMAGVPRPTSNAGRTAEARPPGVA